MEGVENEEIFLTWIDGETRIISERWWWKTRTSYNFLYIQRPTTSISNLNLHRELWDADLINLGSQVLCDDWRIDARTWLLLEKRCWKFPPRICCFHRLLCVSHNIIAEVILGVLLGGCCQCVKLNSQVENIDLLGTLSTGINFVASCLIFSGSSAAALLKICITLALFLLIFSNCCSLFSSVPVSTSVRRIPSATESSIAWAPPWPWWGNMGCAASPIKRSFPLCHDGIGALKRSGHCLISFAFLRSIRNAPLLISGYLL